MVFGFFCEGISGEENNVKEGKGLLKYWDSRVTTDQNFSHMCTSENFLSDMY